MATLHLHASLSFPLYHSNITFIRSTICPTLPWQHYIYTQHYVSHFTMATLHLHAALSVPLYHGNITFTRSTICTTLPWQHYIYTQHYVSHFTMATLHLHAALSVPLYNLYHFKHLIQMFKRTYKKIYSGYS